MNFKKDQELLITWYQKNKRTLPWRSDRDPYKIWISEVMLQQTTVVAVIPYYEKFIKRFPTVHTLAKAKEHDVIEMWAGLGYYSRARNIYKSSQLLSKNGFAQTAQQLIELPGFGPYTSRAVASLAFGEKVGVLDGNVIRVLSRYYGLKIKWWNGQEKQKLQVIADQLAQTKLNSDLNQGLMELGATICTPQKPLCLMCPWKTDCQALKKNLITQLPLAKPKTPKHIWHCEVQISLKNNKIFLKPNLSTPFLKKLEFPPLSSQELKTKPKSFDLKHSVTKYDIYISVKKSGLKKMSDGQWVDLDKIKKINPTSLMTKILKFVEK